MYLPLNYYDIHLNSATSISIDTEENRSVMLFTLSGEATIGGKRINEKTAVKLTPGDYVKIESETGHTQILFVSSTMLDEPVAWGGPIVMNTKEELNKAFDDLDRGTFLREDINY